MGWGLDPQRLLEDLSLRAHGLPSRQPGLQPPRVRNTRERGGWNHSWLCRAQPCKSDTWLLPRPAGNAESLRPAQSTGSRVRLQLQWGECHRICGRFQATTQERAPSSPRQGRGRKRRAGRPGRKHESQQPIPPFSLQDSLDVPVVTTNGKGCIYLDTENRRLEFGPRLRRLPAASDAPEHKSTIWSR